MVATRLLLVGLACAAATSPALAAPKYGTAGRVSARVYDYARLAPGQVEAAQQQVAATYQEIGVVIEWRQAARPAAAAAGLDAWPTDGDARFTVALITSEMAGRVQLAPNVAGFAAGDRDSGGRMVFVVVERTQGLARRGRLFHHQVLGSVISHELAHLLLPSRHHSRWGIMRPNWSATDFGRPGRHSFSRDDARAIREAVGALSGGPARVAD